MKNKLFIVVLLVFTGYLCFAQKIETIATHDVYDLIKVPLDYGSTLTYVKPHYPQGVSKEIYNKIWACYVKTIERGDYDYDAYNKHNEGDPNWTTDIEYKDSDSFRFHGVCYQYADYFELLLKKDPVLKSLIDKGILRSESAPSHKYWVYQKPGDTKYFIDPTWGDWTVFGTPKGDFAGWVEMEKRIENSPARKLLVDAIMHSWFFIQANAIGAARTNKEYRNWDRTHHNLK